MADTAELLSKVKRAREMSEQVDALTRRLRINLRFYKVSGKN